MVADLSVQGALDRQEETAYLHPPRRDLVIGVLALQGSFVLHREALQSLGVNSREVRRPEDLSGIHGLILPGGESTVLSKLSQRNGLFDRMIELGTDGLPMFGTCAGAILLGSGSEYPPLLNLVPVVVERNAYGRQKDSFEKFLDLEPFDHPYLCIFIRAPKISLPDSARHSVEVLGQIGGDPILLRYRNLLQSTFHPELTDDLRVHEYFLEIVRGTRRDPPGLLQNRPGAKTAAP